MISIDLSGKAVVVIGGSRGIGAAIVRRSAEAGGRVAWSYHESAGPSEALLAEVRKRGAEAFHARADCTDEKAIRSLIEQATARWGRLDGLVYNAGFTTPKPLAELTLDDWRRVVDINLNGAFVAAQAGVERMGAGGSIVLIGSAAIVAGGGGRADYAAAKAGLEGLCRAIAREFGPRRIRCNVIHPSLIDTDLMRSRHPDPAKREALAAAVPLRRLGTPDDIAFAAVFLLSDLASYIAAQSLFIDGGRTFCRA
jgi:3-oxoacyl-[acyl-carrier protein] reductase